MAWRAACAPLLRDCSAPVTEHVCDVTASLLRPPRLHHSRLAGGWSPHASAPTPQSAIKEEKDVLVLTDANFDDAIKAHDPLLVRGRCGRDGR